MHGWASVGGAYLSAAAMIVLAITGWRAVDATLVRDAEFKREQREFNTELVDAIGNLAEKTGVLTSADFCPVRFRLRFPGGGIPAQKVRAGLTNLAPNAHESLECCSTGSGTIDFGLQPPGRYRLQLTAFDGMVLEHEFEVLPGVAVDRVIFYPKSWPPGVSPVNLEIVVNWPGELSSEDLIALIEIDPGPFEAGDWSWKRAGDRPLQAIAATSLDHDSAAEALRHLQLAGKLSGEFQPDPYAVAAVPVPYRHCQIGAITFLRRRHDSPSPDQFRVLGTLLYSPKESSQSATGRCWEALDAPPRYEVDPSLKNQWTVEIPIECTRELLERIQETTRSLDVPT